MTNRELLELAAKAAGVGGQWEFGYRDANGRAWNALEDDGDALRLAVKLRLEVIPFEGGGVDVARWVNGLQSVHVSEADINEYAATRRAIVRAAAETARLRGHLPQPDAVERERSNEIRRLAIRALCAWDESVLPKSNDGMMQERMEDLRAALEKDGSATAPPIWETLAEIGESAPAGTWDALPAEKLQGQHQ